MEKVVTSAKSAWLSKINWTQAVAFLGTILALFGIDLDAETRAHILALIASITPIVTWVLRTWFTKEVTKASAANLPQAPPS